MAVRRGKQIFRYLMALAALIPALVPTESWGLSESDFLSDIPMVLTASRLSQPLNQAPAAVSIINREMIEASGATNIAELLRLVPGFIVAERRGEQYTTAYRAMGEEYTRYLQVLVDGVSVYQVYFGEMHWWTLPVPVEEVERIEVVRSPNAATYGSNSFQGVINIVTRDPATSKGGSLVLQSGTQGFYRGMVRYAGGNEQMAFRATAGVKKNNGFENFPDTTRIPFVLLRGDVNLSKIDRLQVQFGQSNTEYQNGFPDSEATPPHPASVVDQMFQVRWNHVLGEGADISLQYARSRFRYFDEWSIMLGAPIFAYPISLNYEGGRDSLELTHRLHPSATSQLVWGVEARRDFVQSDTWFYFDKSLHGDLMRLFANGEWRATPDLTLNAGAMLEKHYFTGSKSYPRLAANYAVSPEQTLRASVSKGFRPPTFGEQKVEERFYWEGNLLQQRFTSQADGLQPETVISREIGYLGEWRSLGLTVDARLSVDNYQDMISTIRTTNPAALVNQDVLQFKNAYDMSVTGGELQVRWQAGQDDLVVANLAHNKIHSSNRDATLSGPLNIGSLMLSHRFSPAWRASATYYRYGSMKWLSGGDYIPKYERLDMKLAWKLRPRHGDDELALIVKNALDRENVSFNNTNRERLAGFLSLTLSF